MNRNFAGSLAVGSVAILATLSAGVVTCANAAGDDPASGDPRFVSTLSREEVQAEARKPFPGGNPWSGQYNMFQLKNPATGEQVQGDFLKARAEVDAFTAEDSGSAYLMKYGQHSDGNSSATGAPAR